MPMTEQGQGPAKEAGYSGQPIEVLSDSKARAKPRSPAPGQLRESSSVRPVVLEWGAYREQRKGSPAMFYGGSIDPDPSLTTGRFCLRERPQKPQLQHARLLRQGDRPLHNKPRRIGYQKRKDLRPGCRQGQRDLGNANRLCAPLLHVPDYVKGFATKTKRVPMVGRRAEPYMAGKITRAPAVYTALRGHASRYVIQVYCNSFRSGAGHDLRLLDRTDYSGDPCWSCWASIRKTRTVREERTSRSAPARLEQPIYVQYSMLKNIPRGSGPLAQSGARFRFPGALPGHDLLALA